MSFNRIWNSKFIYLGSLYFQYLLAVLYIIIMLIKSYNKHGYRC